MPINMERAVAEDLTIFTGEGELSSEEIVSSVESLYEGPDPTGKTIWDLREAKLNRIPSSEVEQIARSIQKYLRDRNDDKVAFVVRADVDYGIVRMYQAYAGLARIPVNMGVFRSLDEALEWLSGTE